MTSSLLPLLLASLLGAAQSTGTMSPTSDVSGNRVKATGSTTGRSLKDRFAECVNLLDFGADPTGVGDSTAALKAALEKALNIVAGTLDTGFDTYANIYDVTKRRLPVCVPAGVYRLTSRIRVGFANVQIIGAGKRGGGSLSGGTTVFLKDHTDDAFYIDAATGRTPYNFQLVGVAIRPASGRENTGAGVRVYGPEWFSGLLLRDVSISTLHDGVYIGTVAAGTVSQVYVESSHLGNNAGWGFYSSALLTISGFEKSTITQNSTGGISAGGFMSYVKSVDFEGQRTPLVINGSNGSGWVVENGYFELNTAAALVDLGLSHQPEVRGIFDSGGRAWAVGSYPVGYFQDNLGRRYQVATKGPGQSTSPPTGEGVNIDTGDGYLWNFYGYLPAPVRAQNTNGARVSNAATWPLGAINLDAAMRTLPVYGSSGTAQYASEAIFASNVAASRLDRRSVSDLAATVVGPTSTATDFAGRRLSCTLMTGGNGLTAPAASFTLAPDEVLLVDVAVKLTGADLTSSDSASVMVQGITTTMSWTDPDALTSPTSQVGAGLYAGAGILGRAGDTFFISAAIRNTWGKTYSSIRTYVYIPNQTGQDAYVSRVVYRKVSTSLPTYYQPLNVAEVLWQYEQGQAGAADVFEPTWTGSTVPIDASRSTVFTVTSSTPGSFTIAAPTNPSKGQRITIRVRNTSGGALGAVTWEAAYKVATGATWDASDTGVLAPPATGQSRTVEFVYDGANWLEAGRTPSDVPN